MYWLIKSEPETFSIDDFKHKPHQTERWDGIRNYQARNYLKQMRPKDLALFYHSSCAHIGIMGIVEVVSLPYPDPTALHPDSPYFDPKSSPNHPRWCAVDVRLRQRFAQIIPLEHLKREPALQDLPLVKRGNRLSVMPVTAEEWNCICHLETNPS